MNFKKLIYSVFMLAALCAAPLAASAAPVTAVRSSVSPARVRLVFDSREPVKYTAEKNGLQLVVTLPEGTALTQSPVFKQDAVIKNITVPVKKKKKAQVVIDLTKDCQYKLYNLKILTVWCWIFTAFLSAKQRRSWQAALPIPMRRRS